MWNKIKAKNQQNINNSLIPMQEKAEWMYAWIRLTWTDFHCLSKDMIMHNIMVLPYFLYLNW